MPTVVQLPELGQVQVSRLQAVDRPVEKGTLSTFIQDIVPQVAAGFSKYKEESRDRLIALGRADEINEVTREVNFIDAKQYAMGNEFQRVIGTQAQSKADFTTTVQRMAGEGKGAQEIFDYGQEFLRSSVDTIYNSGLDSDLKTKLYESNIAENAVYQKVISDTIRKVSIDKAYANTETVTARLADALMVHTKSEQDQEVFIQAYLKNVVDVNMSADPDLTLEKAHADALAKIGSVYKFWVGQIDPSNPDADTVVNRMDNLLSSAYKKGFVDIDTLVGIQGLVAGTRTKIEAFNAEMLKRNTIEFLAKADTGEVLLDEATAEQFIVGSVWGSNASESAKTQAYGDITGAYVKSVTSQQEGKIDFKTIDQFVNYNDYYAAKDGVDASPSAWVNDWKTYFLKGGMSGSEAGVSLIQRGITGSQEMPEAIKEGSSMVSQEFSGYLGMTEQEATTDADFKKRNEAFQAVGALYRQWKDSNVARADALLDGVPEQYRDPIKRLWDTGGKLVDVREAIKNPIARTKQRENFDGALAALKADASPTNDKGKDYMRLNKWFNGSGGGFFKTASTKVKNAQSTNMLMVMQDSAHLLSTGLGSPDPEALMSAARTQGLILKSPNGYADMPVFKTAAKTIGSFKAESGAPIAQDTTTRIIDNYRERIAGQLNISPNNVLVRSTEDAAGLVFEAYSEEGVRLNDVNTAGISGGFLPMNRLLYSAQTLHKTLEAKSGANQKSFPKPNDYSRNMANPALGLQGAMSGGRQDNAYSINTKAKMNTGIPLRNVAGKTVATLKLPALATTAMGGNVGLTESLMGTWNVFESWTNNKSYVNGVGNKSRSGFVYGYGMRPDMHPKWARRLEAAAGDDTKMFDVQAAFMSEYFRADNSKTNMAAQLRSVGAPAPTQAPYAPEFKRSALLIADAWWHGGYGDMQTVKEAMNAPNYKAGLSILRKSTSYNAAADTSTHKRSVWYEDSLRQHFKAKGKL